jgi:hypothetical protein
MLGVIILIYEKLPVIMRAEILKNSNNLFKQLFLKPPTHALCRISVVECSC